MVNQDLALISQQYLKNGFIKVFIDKPQVTIVNNPDYSWLEVRLISQRDLSFTLER